MADEFRSGRQQGTSGGPVGTPDAPRANNEYSEPNDPLEIRPFDLIKTVIAHPWFWLLVVIAVDVEIIGFASREFPSGPTGMAIDAVTGHRYVNYFDQPGDLSFYAYGSLCLVILYVLKFIIVRSSLSNLRAAMWYVVLVCASIPCIGIFVSPDWHNRFATIIAVWICAPVQVLVVPTGSFVIDMIYRRSPPDVLLCRYPFELMLVPVWCLVFGVLSFFLGMHWI